MTTTTNFGLDLAKKVFQVHSVDAECKVVVARAAGIFGTAQSLMLSDRRSADT